MAVIKYSALVDQLRGNLNGTVFSRFHAGFNSYKKGQPKRWGSSNQQDLRQSLGFAAQSWSILTPQQRTDWTYVAANTPVPNRLGEPVLIPGFQYFLKFQQYRATIGLPRSFNVDQSLTKPYSLTISPNFLNTTQTGRHFSITNANMFFTITANSTAITELMIYISNPLSYPGASYDSTFYYVNNVPLPANLGNSYSSAFQRSNLQMPQGWSTYNGARHLIMVRPVNFAGAQTAPVAIGEFNSQFTPPAPPEWPITWSFSGNDGRFTELQNAGGTWQPQGTGTWLASPSENLAGVAADYEFELAMSPNLFSSDIARPEEFDDPRPTLSGTLAAKSSFAPYYITPATIGDLQAWMRSNFSYTSGDGYKYQPTAIRIKNPTSGAWSNWGYSNIWLPIF